MAGLPGRKPVVILSDNLPLATPDEVDPVSRGKAIGSGIGGPILASMRHGWMSPFALAWSSTPSIRAG